jgi:alpha-L-fucosidase 2
MILMRKPYIFFFLVFLTYSLNGQRNKFYNRSASIVVSKYKIEFNEPPAHIPSTYSVDAPLLGNGSTGVAISGAPEKQIFYLARNDFWRLRQSYYESFPSVLGKLELNMPVFKDAKYHVEQDLYTGTTYLNFSKGNTSIKIKMYVSAIEDLLILELENTGKAIITGDLVLKIPDEETDVLQSKMARGIDKNIQWISRQFDDDVDIPTKAACAMKIMEASSNRFNLSQNDNLYLSLSFSSNFKSEDCCKHALDKINAIDKKDFFDLFTQHKRWWSDYWNKSFISINDSLLELDYYRSLYIMGSCSRDLEFPPGIFGTWITKELPQWCGDYHLNWNHHAPFYGLFSSNRIEQALPYNYPILAMAGKGREYSKNVFGIDGIVMPVGIGPKSMDIFKAGPVTKEMRQFYYDYGFIEDEGLFFYQRSNALHCAAMMSMLCYYTYNKDYIKLVYPFVKGVVDFWEGFLKYENGRYVIYNDAVEEGPSGDMNPIKSLGLLRSALLFLIDMSQELKVDQDKVKDWENILSKLSKYPTYEKNGKILFASTERGHRRQGINTRLYQIIFPGGQINLDSDKELLEIARNNLKDDISSSDWFTNDKHSNFPAAVRLGYDPDTILKKLTYYIENLRGTNGFLNEYIVGIEACATTPTTLNEMVLRSRPNIIEVFPVWNKEKDALFQDLRAEGAFLVSSQVRSGDVQYIKIISEQGRDCNIVNPWHAKTLSVIRNGKDTKLDAGKRFTLKTNKNDILIIFPWDDKVRKK